MRLRAMARRPAASVQRPSSKRASPLQFGAPGKDLRQCLIVEGQRVDRKDAVPEQGIGRGAGGIGAEEKCRWTIRNRGHSRCGEPGPRGTVRGGNNVHGAGHNDSSHRDTRVARDRYRMRCPAAARLSTPAPPVASPVMSSCPDMVPGGQRERARQGLNLRKSRSQTAALCTRRQRATRLSA